MVALNAKEALPDIIAFEWDGGNLRKNRLKHGVEPRECEEVFFNKPFLIDEDVTHSHGERRMRALGQTHRQRRLFVVFTLREGKIRIVSARDQSRKERAVYKKWERTGHEKET